MNATQDFRYTFTVFTPTYNRASLLPRVYECLTKQTFKDFEWLVVDDGSKDDTQQIVEKLKAGAPFPVRYVLKPNGGKPTAVNRGAKEAEGAFFAVLDSDDWYKPEALERFLFHWKSIPADVQKGFVGVTALCSLPSGEILGMKFPQDVLDVDVIELRYQYKVTGEKSGFLRTDVLRQFPYPEDLGKYISESLVWNRIAKNYKTRFVNEVLTIKDFQDGGITDTGRYIQIRDTKASLLCAKELIGLGNRLPLVPRVKAYSNYVRHSLHQGISFSQQAAEAPSKALFCCCFPLGLYLKMSDARMVKAFQK